MAFQSKAQTRTRETFSAPIYALDLDVYEPRPNLNILKLPARDVNETRAFETETIKNWSRY